MCSGKSAFSFLEGVNPDTVSLLETKERVANMLYSQSSGLIYVACHCFNIAGFKWEEKNETFKKQFEISIKDTTYLSIYAITLAPQGTSGGDQIYVSVENRDGLKNVYRLGGRELEKIALLPDTSYIDDECYMWLLASNIDRHILLIHPILNPFIYIHVKEQKHGKVDLNQLNFPVRTWLLRIELIGQLLILGDYENGDVGICELILTESDAFFISGSEIESYDGSFAALSHVLGDEDEQLHLFKTKFDKDKDCTYISEYKFSLSVSGSDRNQLPMQPIRTLRVKGEFCPYYLVNVNSCSPVLIGKNSAYLHGNLTAIQLTKQHITHHVQQSTQEHSEQHTRTAVNSECVIS